jgi:predicted nucleic acid-binding protein
LFGHTRRKAVEPVWVNVIHHAGVIPHRLGFELSSIKDAALCDLAPEVLAQAISSLENNVLRGMDAIHIGSAVVLKADVFVSSDKRQCAATDSAELLVKLV